MPPDTIVEHLDVFKHDLHCMLAGFKFEVMQAFRFERAEEAFHWRIVPTVAFMAHGVALSSPLCSCFIQVRKDLLALALGQWLAGWPRARATP